MAASHSKHVGTEACLPQCNIIFPLNKLFNFLGITVLKVEF